MLTEDSAFPCVEKSLALILLHKFCEYCLLSHSLCFYDVIPLNIPLRSLLSYRRKWTSICMSSLLYLPCSPLPSLRHVATHPNCEIGKQSCSSLNRWENRNIQDQQNCPVLQSLTVTKLRKNEEFLTFKLQ